MIDRIWARPARSAPRDVALVRRLIPDDDVQRALVALRAWPEHRPTALRRLTAAARRARVDEVLYKDESKRFGAGSFKAAGAAYAVQCAVAEARAAGIPRLTLCCATDGNHGRAVAWAARRCGCDAVVYLPAHARPERERRIRALGASTVSVEGNYDTAVERVRRDAERNGWILISDTSEDAADPGTLRVMCGYALIVDEIVDQLGESSAPTHVFLQAGVGTMAAAVSAELARRLGPDTPRVVVVEPERAACVLPSLEAGRPVAAAGALDTLMDCLAAGRVSATAWPILREWVDGALAISDSVCAAALREARAGGFGEPLDAGPSGIAGLAGLLAAAENDDARASFALNEASRVLLIGTEESLPRG